MSRRTGLFWEGVAERYLRQRGLKPIARNVTCRWGELDLIMRDRDTLVIVEVRYRQSHARVTAIESIDRGKRLRLCRAAGDFVSRHRRFQGWPIRFDVVALSGGPIGTGVNWRPAAFDCDGC